MGEFLMAMYDDMKEMSCIIDDLRYELRQEYKKGQEQAERIAILEEDIEEHVDTIIALQENQKEALKREEELNEIIRVKDENEIGLKMIINDLKDMIGKLNSSKE